MALEKTMLPAPLGEHVRFSGSQVLAVAVPGLGWLGAPGGMGSLLVLPQHQGTRTRTDLSRWKLGGLVQATLVSHTNCSATGTGGLSMTVQDRTPIACDGA